MKLFHISDLHLGIRLYDFDLIEDQKYILDRIVALASEHKPDAVLICGDIYDRNIPSEAAVRLFDSFIWDLRQLKLKIFIIGGNHDSSDRLSFGSRLMEAEDVYISPAYSGHVSPVEVEDDLGSVSIYSLPFIKPASVRRFFPDEDIKDYTDAVGAAIAEMNPDSGKRNVLLCHQFVTGAQRSESEDLVIGGLDNTDSSVFRDFDYVALGHIHSPQNISSDSSTLIRYCGTPLKYSISESAQTKSVTCVELLEKGSVSMTTIPLIPS